eukprot:g7446.t1
MVSDFVVAVAEETGEMSYPALYEETERNPSPKQLEKNKELVTGNAVAELFAQQYEKQLTSKCPSETKIDKLLDDECFSEMQIQNAENV